MRVQLKNDVQKYKEVKIGYSFTTLIFGSWVPLLRGQWGTFFLMALTDIVCAIFEFLTFGIFLGSSFGVTHALWAIGINKRFAKRLLARGYQPVNESSKDYLHDRGLLTTKKD